MEDLFLCEALRFKLHYSFGLALASKIRWKARLFQLVRFVRAIYGISELKRCEQGSGPPLNTELAMATSQGFIVEFLHDLKSGLP